MSDTSIDPPPILIDWATITEKIECPLCLYNLRGLAEPRCPECGYQFQWIDLLDPKRRRHRYLFEHHPKRNAWSFFRTLIGGLRTRRFWSELKPTHILSLRRLILYWLLCSLFLVLMPLVEALNIGANMASTYAMSRRMWPPAIPNLYTPQTRQQYVNRALPLPPDPAFFRQVLENLKVQYFFRSAGLNMAMILLWPWLTFATLMIFQASMKRAKVQQSHVLRCVIYCADFSLWYLLLTVLVTSSLIFLSLTSAGARMNWPFVDQVAGMILWLLFLGRLYRLGTAYRNYLRFDHPFFTALASQVIVVLAAAAIMFWTWRIIHALGW